MTARQQNMVNVKRNLFEMLKKENAFWSYDTKDLHLESLSDDQLIALTLRHLDIPEIDALFSIFSFRKIKDAWRKLLVPEGEYLYTLNRFFAWYYFKAKRPDAYLKSLITRHTNQLFS